jgi:hypothetical protein
MRVQAFCRFSWQSGNSDHLRVVSVGIIGVLGTHFIKEPDFGLKCIETCQGIIYSRSAFRL